MDKLHCIPAAFSSPKIVAGNTRCILLFPLACFFSSLLGGFILYLEQISYINIWVSIFRSFYTLLYFSYAYPLLQAMDNSTTLTNCTQAVQLLTEPDTAGAFSIMFVSVCMTCFVWQIVYLGLLLRQSFKPLYILMFIQAVGGCICAFVTLLTSLISVSCNFVSTLLVSIWTRCPKH
jgi:hypothetical protein